MTIYHDGSWSQNDLELFADGYTIERCGKHYKLCARCFHIVRIDKPLIGGLHSCVSDSFGR